MAYEGEVIATIPTRRGDLELRALTLVERADCGRDLYCLVGASHWNPANFFTKLAEDHEVLAEAFRKVEQYFDPADCPECGDAIERPHYHRDTLDGPEVVFLTPAVDPLKD